MSAQNRNIDKKRLAAFRDALYAQAEQNAEQALTAREQLLDALDSTILPPGPAQGRRVASVIAAAAVLLMAGVGLLLLVMLSSSSTERQELTGLLTLDRATSLAPRQYAVPSMSGAKMVWPDSTTLWLKGSTDVGLKDDTLSHLEITTGALLAAVAPREQGGFAIQTPLGTVRVHGTIFSVWVLNEAVTVRLHEGEVTFEGPQGVLRLNSGESIRIAKGKERIVRLIDEDGLLQDLMIAERTVELSGPPVPILGRNIEMAPLDVTAQRPDAPHHTVKRSTKNRLVGSARTDVNSAALDTALDTSDTGPAPLADPELQAIDVTPHPILPKHLLIESLIRERAYEECIVQAEKALTAPGPNVNQERMLYLKGYCEMRSGNLKAGREAFERYLIRFPSGRHQKRIQDILGE